MPGLGLLKLQKNPLRSIPTGVIFISSPRVNLISTKGVTFFRREGSICTDFSIPHSRPTNGKIYFKKEELDRWIASKTGTTETDDTDSSDSIDPVAPMNDLYIN